MLIDQETDELFVPLNHMREDQESFLEVTHSKQNITLSAFFIMKLVSFMFLKVFGLLPIQNRLLCKLIHKLKLNSLS